MLKNEIIEIASKRGSDLNTIFASISADLQQHSRNVAKRRKKNDK